MAEIFGYLKNNPIPVFDNITFKYISAGESIGQSGHVPGR
jgi:hypothetical protein